MFRNVYVNATIVNILDPCIIYPYCLVCYKKLNPQSSVRWQCPTCRETYWEDTLEFRYRLTFTASDGRSIHKISTFGKYLDPIFGTKATNFKRYLDNLERNQELVKLVSTTALLKQAMTEVFVGTLFIMGFHIPTESNLAKKISSFNRQDLLHWQPELSEIAEAVTSSDEKSIEQNLLAYQLFRAHCNLSSVYSVLEKKVKQFCYLESSSESSCSGQTTDWSMAPSSSSTTANSQGTDSLYAEGTVILSCEERMKRNCSTQKSSVVRPSEFTNTLCDSVTDVTNSTICFSSVSTNIYEDKTKNPVHDELIQENNQIKEINHSENKDGNGEQIILQSSRSIDDSIPSGFFNTWDNETILKHNSSNIFSKNEENVQFIEMPSSENIDAVLQNNSFLYKSTLKGFDSVSINESTECVNIHKGSKDSQNVDSKNLQTPLKNDSENKVVNSPCASVDGMTFSESFFSNNRISEQRETELQYKSSSVNTHTNSATSSNNLGSVSEIMLSPKICLNTSKPQNTEFQKPENIYCHDSPLTFYNNTIFPTEKYQNTTASCKNRKSQTQYNDHYLKKENSALQKLSEDLFSTQNENSCLQSDSNSLNFSKPLPSAKFTSEGTFKSRTNRKHSLLRPLNFRNRTSFSPDVLTSGSAVNSQILNTPSLSSVINRSTKKSVCSSVRDRISQSSAIFSPLLFSCSSPLPCLSQSLFSGNSFTVLESPSPLSFKRDKLNNRAGCKTSNRLGEMKVDFRKRQNISNTVLSPIQNITPKVDKTSLFSQDMFQSPIEKAHFPSQNTKYNEVDKENDNSLHVMNNTSITTVLSFANSVNQTVINYSADLFENSESEELRDNSTLVADKKTPRNSHITTSRIKDVSWQSPDLF